MHVWYLDDAARFKAERAEIERLKASAEWLTEATWRLEENLCVDAAIRVGTAVYQARMTYPNHYPKIPPVMRPVNAERRWTFHQYGGINGALCLEWGSDNWHPGLTGANMLESVFRLLCGETLATMGVRKELVVPSRHQLNVGQELDAQKIGYYIGDDLMSFLNSASFRELGVFRFSTHPRQGNFIVFLHEIRLGREGATRAETTIPAFIKNQFGADNLAKGVFVKLDLPAEAVVARTVNELVELIKLGGVDTDVFSLQTSLDRDWLGFENAPTTILIVDRDNQPHLFVKSDDDSISEIVYLRSGARASVNRLPANLAGLAGKKVCIVGAGSAGSKLAMSLARMNIGELLLIDFDVFLPENIERHTLDWSAVGAHKVAALKDAVLRLGSNTEVTISTLDLTGQESNAAIAALVNLIGICDLVVDATAEPRVFELLAGFCYDDEKPFVWLEVFAGGKGGLVARSRPGRDADPYSMRTAYNFFCQGYQAPLLTVERDYAASENGQEPISASDADVAVIAHHAAKLVADSLLAGENSDYQSSMYLIGLSRWWIFQDAMQIFPINADAFRQNEAATNKSIAEFPEEFAFIKDLTKKREDAIANSGNAQS